MEEQLKNISAQKIAQSLGGAPPPALNSSELARASCPCNRILVSSLGPAAQAQPQAMGVYTQSYTSYNNHASYRQNYGKGP